MAQRNTILLHTMNPFKTISPMFVLNIAFFANLKYHPCMLTYRNDIWPIRNGVPMFHCFNWM